jgi:hypothetical protein
LFFCGSRHYPAVLRVAHSHRLTRYLTTITGQWA